MQENDERTNAKGGILTPRPHRQRTQPKVWLAAFLLTLLFHGAMMVMIVVSRPFAPTIVEAQYPDPVELVFASAVEPQAEKDEPTFFSELPPDRADEPSESADFLSNVDSRARDLVPGGEENDMPHLEGASDAPHVRIDPATQPSVEPEPGIVQQENRAPPNQTVVPETDGSDTPSQSDQIEPVPEVSEPDDQPERTMPEQREVPTPRLLPPSPGLADFFQEEMNRPGSNAALSGIVSINTLAWDYAPWLQRFRRDFLRSWAAPVAYYMGIIDGYTVVELAIAPSGELLRLERIEGKGHESLHQCSVDVFKALAPYHPLPESFPEESLVLRIKLVYPPTRRR